MQTTSMCTTAASAHACAKAPALVATHAYMPYFATFVDQFSQVVRLIPTVSTLDCQGFVKLFLQYVYPHYGLPLGICSDGDVPWNTAVFKAFVATWELSSTSCAHTIHKQMVK